MLNDLLTIVKGDGSSWAGQSQAADSWYFDNFGEPIIYALIGIAIVFLGIILLIAIFWLVSFIIKNVNGMGGTQTQKKTESAKTVQKAEEPAAATETLSQEEEVPAEVKAAIIAAVLAYCREEQPKCEFTVKRIKRI